MLCTARFLVSDPRNGTTWRERHESTQTEKREVREDGTGTSTMKQHQAAGSGSKSDLREDEPLPSCRDLSSTDLSYAPRKNKEEKVGYICRSFDCEYPSCPVPDEQREKPCLLQEDAHAPGCCCGCPTQASLKAHDLSIASQSRTTLITRSAQTFKP